MTQQFGTPPSMLLGTLSANWMPEFSKRTGGMTSILIMGSLKSLGFDGSASPSPHATRFGGVCWSRTLT